MRDSKFLSSIGSESPRKIWKPTEKSSIDPHQPHFDEPEESYVRRHLLFGKLSELQEHQRGDTRSHQDYLSTIPVSSTSCSFSLENTEECIQQNKFSALTPIPSNHFNGLNYVDSSYACKIPWYKDWTKDAHCCEIIEEESKLADLAPDLFEYEAPQIELCKDDTGQQKEILADTNWETTEWSGKKNIAKYLQHREISGPYLPKAPVSKSSYMLTVLENKTVKEQIIPTPKMNKVFCSTWLNESDVIFGTKSAELCVYENLKNKLIDIPVLKGTPGQENSYLGNLKESPIHTVSQNPSKTFLLTQGKPASCAAIYRLPTLEPFCLGEDGHQDLIFDSCWLDDNYFCTTARDSTACIWKVEDTHWSSTCDNHNDHQIIWPRGRQLADASDILRTVSFNPRSAQIVAITSRSSLLVWDSSTFQLCMTGYIDTPSPCMCMSMHSSGSFFACSAYANVRFVDARSYKLIHSTSATDLSTNLSVPLRSMNFQGDILSIGYGDGVMHFYDIRARRYFTSTNGEPMLKCSKNLSYNSFDKIMVESPSAIYTHSYDPTGTKMFVGGGSLCYTYDGCYASVWK